MIITAKVLRRMSNVRSTLENEQSLAGQSKKPQMSIRDQLLVIAAILCVLFVAGYIYLSDRGRQSDQLADLPDSMNRADEMAVEMAQKYNLVVAIDAYDPVIDAIEHYREDYGAYPASLSVLVPSYLSEAPGIYIRGGESLHYSPDSEYVGSAPFTFYVYGHHTGLQSMHGWEFKYCPVELDYCNEPDDRHYHPHRMNDRWIWINRSAL
jgi:hypothetical protein